MGMGGSGEVGAERRAYGDIRMVCEVNQAARGTDEEEPPTREAVPGDGTGEWVLLFRSVLILWVVLQ